MLQNNESADATIWSERSLPSASIAAPSSGLQCSAVPALTDLGANPAMEPSSFPTVIEKTQFAIGLFLFAWLQDLIVRFTKVLQLLGDAIPHATCWGFAAGPGDIRLQIHDFGCSILDPRSAHASRNGHPMK